MIITFVIQRVVEPQQINHVILCWGYALCAAYRKKVMTYAILDLHKCRILCMCQSGRTVGFWGLGCPYY